MKAADEARNSLRGVLVGGDPQTPGVLMFALFMTGKKSAVP
jgi:hypothetical protein